MGEGAVVRRLRAMIPETTCKAGCTECCAYTVPFTRWEWKQLKIKGKPQRRSPCQFKTAAGCAIYEKRPILCRLFGTTRGDRHLDCSHAGVTPEIPLSHGKARDILSEWKWHVRNAGYEPR